MNNKPLKLNDDFINPSQQCSRLMKGNELHSNDSECSSKRSVDLSDCIACGGCVTSSETALMNQQNIDELFQVLQSSFHYPVKWPALDQQSHQEKFNRRYKVMIVSISPQSLASIAAYFNCSMIEAERRLHFVFHKFGALHVFDTSWSRHFTHLEICHEFDAKFASIAEQRKREMEPDFDVRPRSAKRSRKEICIPMLTSSCPGFVCYAEKSFGDFIIPFISTTKSPQQMMGSILKQYYVKLLGEKGLDIDKISCDKTSTCTSRCKSLKSSDIYHVSVMPCFDKKIEAGRPDFQIDNKVNEVDIVLTTSELVAVLQTQFDISSREDFMQLSPDIDREYSSSYNGFDTPLFSFPISDIISYGIKGSIESGGYCETVFRFAAKKYFNVEIPADQPLDFKTSRNSDFKEVELRIGEEGYQQTVLRMAIANGFRNIQNVIRKLKSSRLEYDFIEVMACPSGCINGGGQLPAPENVAAKDHLHHVKELYDSTLVRIHQKTQKSDDDAPPSFYEAYTKWLQGDFYSEEVKNVFHTSYHPHQNRSVNPLTLQW